MKIWLDSITEPPANDWLWIKSTYRAILLLQIAKKAKEPVEISINSDSFTPLLAWWSEKPKFMPYKVNVHGRSKADEEWLNDMLRGYK